MLISPEKCANIEKSYNTKAYLKVWLKNEPEITIRENKEVRNHGFFITKNPPRGI
jgi:hypothetical protein